MSKRLFGSCAVLWTAITALSAQAPPPQQLLFANATGQAETISVNGEVDFDGPFFQPLGTNGRTCATCHQPSDGWTITVQGVNARFFGSGGTDPLFRSNDGSNCEGAAPVTLSEKRLAYSLLLQRGLIRVGFDIPPHAEFTVELVSDPLGCAPQPNRISVYRRPVPTTNLRFKPCVMWDCREPNLQQQANSATRGHAEAFVDLTPEQTDQIVSFETGLYTAQISDNAVGSLADEGALGGATTLVNQPFWLGINDINGGDPTGAHFDFNVFSLYNVWDVAPSTDPLVEARRTVVRGQRLFNHRGCAQCHVTPGAGSRSLPFLVDNRMTNPAFAPYLPVYQLTCASNGSVTRTTDPGRALITGRCTDINRFSTPVLRGLAARAPYFHNGSASTIDAVIERYGAAFATLRLTPSEKRDLKAFLNTL